MKQKPSDADINFQRALCLLTKPPNGIEVFVDNFFINNPNNRIIPIYKQAYASFAANLRKKDKTISQKDENTELAYLKQYIEEIDKQSLQLVKSTKKENYKNMKHPLKPKIDLKKKAAKKDDSPTDFEYFEFSITGEVDIQFDFIYVLVDFMGVDSDINQLVEQDIVFDALIEFIHEDNQRKNIHKLETWKNNIEIIHNPEFDDQIAERLDKYITTNQAGSIQDPGAHTNISKTKLTSKTSKNGMTNKCIELFVEFTEQETSKNLSERILRDLEMNLEMYHKELQLYKKYLSGCTNIVSLNKPTEIFFNKQKLLETVSNISKIKSLSSRSILPLLSYIYDYHVHNTNQINEIVDSHTNVEQQPGADEEEIEAVQNGDASNEEVEALIVENFISYLHALHGPENDFSAEFQRFQTEHIMNVTRNDLDFKLDTSIIEYRKYEPGINPSYNFLLQIENAKLIFKQLIESTDTYKTLGPIDLSNFSLVEKESPGKFIEIVERLRRRGFRNTLCYKEDAVYLVFYKHIPPGHLYWSRYKDNDTFVKSFSEFMKKPEQPVPPKHYKLKCAGKPRIKRLQRKYISASKQELVLETVKIFQTDLKRILCTDGAAEFILQKERANFQHANCYFNFALKSTCIDHYNELLKHRLNKDTVGYKYRHNDSPVKKIETNIVVGEDLHLVISCGEIRQINKGLVSGYDVYETGRVFYYNGFMKILYSDGKQKCIKPDFSVCDPSINTTAHDIPSVNNTIFAPCTLKEVFKESIVEKRFDFELKAYLYYQKDGSLLLDYENSDKCLILPDNTIIYKDYSTSEIIYHNSKYMTIVDTFDNYKARNPTIIKNAGEGSMLGREDIIERSCDGRKRRIVIEPNLSVEVIKEAYADTVTGYVYIKDSLIVTKGDKKPLVRLNEDGEIVIPTSSTPKFNDIFLQSNERVNIFTMHLDREEVELKDDEHNNYKLNLKGEDMTAIAVSLDINRTLADKITLKDNVNDFIPDINRLLPQPKANFSPICMRVAKDSIELYMDSSHYNIMKDNIIVSHDKPIVNGISRKDIQVIFKDDTEYCLSDALIKKLPIKCCKREDKVSHESSETIARTEYKNFSYLEYDKEAYDELIKVIRIRLEEQKAEITKNISKLPIKLSNEEQGIKDRVKANFLINKR